MIAKANTTVLLILCILLAFSGPAAAQPSDITGHWAERQIADWVSKGLAGGYEDGRFKPDNLITRAEFMALANRAFSFTNAAQINFMDISPTDWHAKEVAKAMAAGYISGYEDNTIRPDNEITREEAAAMLYRICKLTTGNFEVLSDFADADSIQWSKAAVASAVAAGYMKGYPDQTFQPARPITRAEAISTMDRAKKGSGNIPGNPAEQTPANVSGTAPEQKPANTNTVTNVTVPTVNVDITPPSFASYPKIYHVTSTTADLQVKTNESGKVYFVVLNDGSAAPTANQVKAGLDAKGAALAANLKGSINVRANITEQVTIYGLVASMHYDIYVVAEDAKPNLQYSPAKVEFNTILPAFVSAETNSGGTQVRITFNKEMANPDGKHKQFTVLVNGSGNIVEDADLGRDDRTINLDLRDAVLYGQTVTVAYTAGTVIAEDGSPLATFQAKSVKNSVIKPPNPPAGIKASAGNGQVTLSWNAVSGAEYKVYQAVSAGGPYSQIASRLDETEYRVGGLLNGVTYYFVVKANHDGGDSVNSSEVNATPLSLPNVPTGLTVSVGNGEATLNWNAVAGAIGYKVYRSNLPGGPYAQIWGGKETGYKSMGLTNGTAYYYVVRAVNASGDSERSNEVIATPVNPPDPPAGLAALAGNGQITLTWNPVAKAATYKVFRSEVTGGPYTQIAAGWDDTGFTVTGLTNGKKYYFVVKATNPAGDSTFSNQAGAAPGALTIPNAPTGLTAMAGDGLAVLSWNPVAGAAGYKVYQSSGGPYVQISAGEIRTSYTAVGLTNGTTYYFVVKAGNASGDSANSNEATATPAVPLPPKAPTGLTAVAGSNQVTLSWNTVAGATGYKVYRAEVPGGPYTQIASGETQTTYTATGLIVGKTYYFVVKAGNASGDSEDSNEAAATPMIQPPDPPTGLTAMAGNGSVTLNWNPATGATGYKVYQSSGGPYAQITAGETRTSFTAVGLTNGTTYYFVVKSSNPGGDSENSNQASATPSP
ncbi:MAG: fibronectin type III domain-containing protein [Bacillota bacterium]